MTVDESKPRVGLCVVCGRYWCVCVVCGRYWSVCGLGLCQVLVCENGEWKMMTVDESKPRVGLCVVCGRYWCVCGLW